MFYTFYQNDGGYIINDDLSVCVVIEAKCLKTATAIMRAILVKNNVPYDRFDFDPDNIDCSDSPSIYGEAIGTDSECSEFEECTVIYYADGYRDSISCAK